ncbi:MAG: DUF4918 family protein [Chitinophagaceae bacterium]|nr:DUF4918 family protein [Chitinophagaceae bacterium]
MNKKTTQADAILHFLSGLQPDFKLPAGVEIMNPFADEKTFSIVNRFYNKFYKDRSPRCMIFGINPGRFGGGITGIPFTDPHKLKAYCGIDHGFKNVKELSADFVYAVVNEFGGAEKFYHKFFITAICPLGFTLNGRNMNYYDDKKLVKATGPFIIKSIEQQLNTIASYKVCFCLGEGTNYKYFSGLNEKFHFFDKIIPLPHPRWIMQYRRKKMEEYVQLYLEIFSTFA